MIPAAEMSTPPVNGLSKAISAVCIQPATNHPTERPPSGNKPLHQQVSRLSQQHRAGKTISVGHFEKS